MAHDPQHAVEEAQKSVQQQVLDILESAGVGEEGRKVIFANPNIMELVSRRPQISSFYAQRYPEQGIGDYYVKEAEFGFTDTMAYLNAYPDAAGARMEDNLRNETMGAKRLANGVLIRIDPSTGEEGVWYPPNDKDIEGSPAWVQKVARKWNDKTRDKWRGRLVAKGYLADGDKRNDSFETGLKAFYRDKYLGNPTPLNGKVNDKVSAAQAYDPVDIRSDIREVYSTVLGDDPSDDELEVWEHRIRDIVRRVIAKGGDPLHAQKKAQETFAEEFSETPGAEVAQQRAETIAESTRVRDGLLSLSQLASI